MGSQPPVGRLGPEVNFALEAMRTASTLLHGVGRSSSSLTKGDRTPVTAADLGVQAALAGLLERSFPHDVLVAEESSETLRRAEAASLRAEVIHFARVAYPEASETQILEWIDRGRGEPAQRFWTLDPVDGTKGLLRGGQFVMALALVEEGAVVLAALACPRYDPFGTGASFALAVRGEGAWAASSLDGTWIRLSVSGESDPARCRLLRSVVSGRATDARLALVRRALGTTAPEVRMDSQVKYLALAAGGGELIVRLPRQKGAGGHAPRFVSLRRASSRLRRVFVALPTPEGTPGRGISERIPQQAQGGPSQNAPPERIRENIWDHAAGVLLVEEAGGKCTDVEGRSLDFAGARQMEHNSGVVASNTWLHEAALEALRRTAPATASAQGTAGDGS
jgi:3'(2'), 5'-bisphosphate nucleotidase